MLITVHRWRRVYLRFGRFVRDLTNMRYGIRITSIGRTRVKIDFFSPPVNKYYRFVICVKIYIYRNRSDRRSVSDEQIILHENPCQESSDSTPSSSTDMTSILVYVVDEKGKFDTNMTKILPSLYEESRDRITFPIKVSGVYLTVSRSRL